MRPRGASKFPDDPSIRVDLAEGFRRDLEQEKRISVAAAVHSPRRRVSAQRLNPSSVSRYVRGKVSPTLTMARRLATAAGRPLAEAVAGFSERHERSTASWAEQLLWARTYRRKAMELLESFSMVLRHIHFGVVSDRQRQYRHQLRPDRDCADYRYFEITFEQPVGEIAPADVVVSYRLVDRPPVFIDYGRITVTAEKVTGFELWTLRSHGQGISPGATSFWIQTWIDGKATDFVVRSSHPFSVGPMVLGEVIPAGPMAIIRFEPGGIHRHAPGGS
jgi:transcriptional regulator with XRE-family HTH domain